MVLANTRQGYTERHSIVEAFNQYERAQLNALRVTSYLPSECTDTRVYTKKGQVSSRRDCSHMTYARKNRVTLVMWRKIT